MSTMIQPYEVTRKVWTEFDDWADTLISDYMQTPTITMEGQYRKRIQIETLQSAKINLQRIIKNYLKDN